MYCKRCGTPLHTGVVICPRVRRRPPAPAGELSAVCQLPWPRTADPLGMPALGRDVRPAGPRWGVWLAVAIGLRGGAAVKPGQNAHRARLVRKLLALRQSLRPGASFGTGADEYKDHGHTSTPRQDDARCAAHDDR